MSKNFMRFAGFLGVMIAIATGFLGVKTILSKGSCDVSLDMGKMFDKENIVPIAIIGSGPAGLTAAIYSARAGLPTFVFEGSEPGGLLTKTTEVENFPGFRSILGPDLIKNMRTHAQAVGAQFVADSIEKIDFSQRPFVLYTEDGKTLHAFAVIVATGATPRKLGITGEEKYWGSGVTACAICDAPFFKNEAVVVIGGGDSAVEEAIQLSSYARTITILVRKDCMRAAVSMQDRLKGYKNIAVQHNVVVKKIVGDDINVTGVELYDNKTKQTTVMPTTGVFLAIGHDPNTQLFKDCLEMDAQGYIILKDRTQQTSVSGVFAAGDVEDHQYRQAIVAAGSGARAALDAANFLGGSGFNADIASQLEPQFFSLEKKTLSYDLQEIGNIDDFNALVQGTKGLVVVDFFAEYCPSCMQMVPVFESVAQEFAGRAMFAKVDTEQATGVVKKLFVHKVPCLLFFKDGQLVARYGNIMSKKELGVLIDQLLNDTQ